MKFFLIIHNNIYKKNYINNTLNAINNIFKFNFLIYLALKSELLINLINIYNSFTNILNVFNIRFKKDNI